MESEYFIYKRVVPTGIRIDTFYDVTLLKLIGSYEAGMQFDEVELDYGNGVAAFKVAVEDDSMETDQRLALKLHFEELL